jgi:hypothetical protein
MSLILKFLKGLECGSSARKPAYQREDLSSNTRIAKKKILKFFPLNIITNNSFDNFLGGTLG